MFALRVEIRSHRSPEEIVGPWWKGYVVDVYWMYLSLYIYMYRYIYMILYVWYDKIWIVDMYMIPMYIYKYIRINIVIYIYICVCLFLTDRLMMVDVFPTLASLSPFPQAPLLTRRSHEGLRSILHGKETKRDPLVLPKIYLAWVMVSLWNDSTRVDGWAGLKPFLSTGI